MRPKQGSTPRIAGAIGIVVVLAFVVGISPLLRNVAGRVLPALGAVGRTLDDARGWIGGASAARVRTLESERVALLAEIAGREELRHENELLRSALNLRREGEAGVLPAGVIGFTREGRDEFLILDRGTDDGASVGDIVIDQNRILGGTVVGVTPRSSRAILLSSASRSIDVIMPTANLRAIARGTNIHELIIELVPADAAISVGDLVVASPRAAGGRRGLVVGRIREVRQSEHDAFKAVRAVHLFNPTADGVLVLLAP